MRHDNVYASHIVVKKVLNVLAEMSRQGFSDVLREHAHALIMTG